MSYLLYSLVLALAMALSLPFWLYQMLRHGKYRRGFSERMGRVPERLRGVSGPVIWIHAVSVGEVLAVGTHKQLMETSPEYVQLYDSQRSTSHYEVQA